MITNQKTKEMNVENTECRECRILHKLLARVLTKLPRSLLRLPSSFRRLQTSASAQMFKSHEFISSYSGVREALKANFYSPAMKRGANCRNPVESRQSRFKFLFLLFLGEVQFSDADESSIIARILLKRQLQSASLNNRYGPAPRECRKFRSPNTRL